MAGLHFRSLNINRSITSPGAQKAMLCIMDVLCNIQCMECHKDCSIISEVRVQSTANMLLVEAHLHLHQTDISKCRVRMVNTANLLKAVRQQVALTDTLTHQRQTTLVDLRSSITGNIMPNPTCLRKTEVQGHKEQEVQQMSTMSASM